MGHSSSSRAPQLPWRAQHTRARHSQPPLSPTPPPPPPAVPQPAGGQALARQGVRCARTHARTHHMHAASPGRHRESAAARQGRCAGMCVHRQAVWPAVWMPLPCRPLPPSPPANPPSPPARPSPCADFNLSKIMEENSVMSSLAATNPRWACGRGGCERVGVGRWMSGWLGGWVGEWVGGELHAPEPWVGCRAVGSDISGMHCMRIARPPHLPPRSPGAPLLPRPAPQVACA